MIVRFRTALLSVLLLICGGVRADAPFPALIDLALGEAPEQAELVGAAPGDLSGFSVTAISDVGDGAAFAISSRWSDTDAGNDAGRVYLFSGGAWLRDAGPVTLGQTGQESVLEGVNFLDSAGAYISTAGDLNGDGLAEILIGATHADPNGSSSGQAYVVMGSTTMPAESSLAQLLGSNGFRMDGIDADDRLGFGGGAAGDFNGDGFGDLLLSAYHGDPAGLNDTGEIYLLFGNEGFGIPGAASVLDLAALDGVNGIRFDGVVEYAETGWAVRGAGDVNADGFADIVIGARSQGTAWLVYGAAQYGTTGAPQTVALATLDGLNGVALHDGGTGTTLGAAVAGGADVNGDGYDDLLLGASFPGFGQIVFGGPQWGARGAAAAVDIASLGESGMLRLTGPNDAGFSVALGDLNADGFADAVLGAPRNDDAGSNAGQVWAVFGSADWGAPGGPAEILLESLDGDNGFAAQGAASDNTGWSVAADRDLDGDGAADLIAGAPGEASFGNPEPGRSFIVFGRALDSDADGLADRDDNCVAVANADQRDTDGDGYGNICDGDLDNNGYVNFLDLGLLKAVFGQTGPGLDADLDGDEAVNFVDVGLMMAAFFGPPGP